MNRIVEVALWVSGIALAASTLSHTKYELPEISIDRKQEVAAVDQPSYSAARPPRYEIDSIASMFKLPAPPAIEVPTIVEDPTPEPVFEAEPEATEELVEEQPVEIEEIVEEPKARIVSWLELVGTATRNESNLFFVKNTRTGLIFDVFKGSEGYAQYEGIREGVLRFILDGELYGIQLPDGTSGR